MARCSASSGGDTAVSDLVVREQRIALVQAPLEDHQPRKPMWCCRSCAQPWPCASGRLHLKTRYGQDPVGLSIRMAEMMADAMRDLYRLNPDDAPSPRAMFDRFLVWTPFKRPVIP
jgi:hypothetical protein